jgi:1,4-alpha-glucan branching enzyme
MLKKQYLKSRKVSKVTFEIPKNEFPEGIEIQNVNLVGEFNDWDITATPMKYLKKGAYQSILELEPGRAYQFRYLVNGEHWCNEWHADAYIPNGFGNDNCVVKTENGTS